MRRKLSPKSQISFKVDPQTADALREIADKKYGGNISECLREAVGMFLEAERYKPPKEPNA